MNTRWQCEELDCYCYRLFSNYCLYFAVLTVIIISSSRYINLQQALPYKRFEFYCVANGIRGDNADKKRAHFVTLLGQETFAKLKTLASPIAVSELTLDAIKQHLNNYFRPVTVEIAERFKFFKRNQKEQESFTDYMSELRRLAKTCNFDAYLETALRDQFVCGLWDVKCQRELL